MYLYEKSRFSLYLYSMLLENTYVSVINKRHSNCKNAALFNYKLNNNNS